MVEAATPERGARSPTGWPTSYAVASRSEARPPITVRAGRSRPRFVPRDGDPRHRPGRRGDRCTGGGRSTTTRRTTGRSTTPPVGGRPGRAPARRTPTSTSSSSAPTTATDGRRRAGEPADGRQPADVLLRRVGRLARPPPGRRTRAGRRRSSVVRVPPDASARWSRCSRRLAATSAGTLRSRDARGYVVANREGAKAIDLAAAEAGWDALEAEVDGSPRRLPGRHLGATPARTSTSRTSARC